MPVAATPGAKIIYPDFRPIGDVLPITPTENIDHMFKRRAPGASEAEEEEIKVDERSSNQQHQQAYDFDSADSAAKQDLLSKFSTIKTRKVVYSGGENESQKPIAIIYNPVSGKKRNLVPQIEERLTSEGVPFDMIPTQQFMDTYNFAKDLDLTKYSVLCCCGGDGTYHETVNGMLAREDKLKIPVAFLPNGSGNDLCNALGIMSLEIGLNYLVKGQCIRMDTIRVLADHDDEDSLPAGLDKLKFCRHMMINSTMGVPAKIQTSAGPLKWLFGTKCYEVASLFEAVKGNFRADTFDLYIDDVKVNKEDSKIETVLIMVTNGKYAGGGMTINPFSCINDGLCDIVFIHDTSINSLLGVASMLGEAKKQGGAHAYKNQVTFLRGKKLRIVW